MYLSDIKLYMPIMTMAEHNQLQYDLSIVIAWFSVSY